ncbi:hypothetical protein TPHA_0N01980 [Tetrapisispora phaffii CBS 4417]|uniref:Uncharacterized protein n=1 Tax=Tetrapisispora phaffii (strain ATCC 24235 / CBS 4417 / NBRC 1672 / NRRL Y-8282 / UCD 70-5) TaxID=1071381 RepID=G8C1F1_TETPH|nr:hypothetical protein TPHA_0N01980 [Tetrapisispora phaffii CBS 4417]CCE65979.1 hypothetical protein TPHA_0N01980 [Tetrapisispora phaffii CBS 4417]
MLQSTKNANKCTFLYTRLLNDELSRYCQVCDDKEICNHLIKFRDSADLSKCGSERCQNHIQKAHPIVFNSDNWEQFLDEEHSPAKRVRTGVKPNMNVINLMKKKKKSKSNEISPFGQVVLIFLKHDIPFSIWDDDEFKERFINYIPTCDSKINRKEASNVLRKASTKIQVFFKNELKKNTIFNNRTIIEFSLEVNSLEVFVVQIMTQLKNSEPPYVNVEMDDWKSNKRISYTAVIFNFPTMDYSKGTFIARFVKAESKKKIDHQLILKSTCDEYNSNNVWTNTCTDNASAVLHCTSELTGSPNYPVYAGHIGCLCHILNVICEKTISRISLKDDKELEKEYKMGKNEEEQEQEQKEEEEEEEEEGKEEIYEIKRIETLKKITINSLVSDPFDGKSTEVLLKLIKLNRELRKSEEKLTMFDKYVSIRISGFISVRWNIKYNILKVFLEHQTEFFKFFEYYGKIGKPINNELDCKDLGLAELLINMLEPLCSLTKFISPNISLSPVYVRLLLFIRRNVVNAERVLKEMGDTRTDLSAVVKLIDKYFLQAHDNFDIIFTCTNSEPFDDRVVEYYEEYFKEKLNLMDSFCSILMKLGRFDTLKKIPSDVVNLQKRR